MATNRINLGRVIGETGQQGARGLTGEKGDNGNTPFIQEGYWWIDDGHGFGPSSTGVKAKASAWLVGNTEPQASLGDDEDWYLDTTNNYAYYKNNGAWQLRAIVKGEQGERGERGESALTFNVGNVTSVSPEQPASVTNSGTAQDIVLDFVIPRGQQGLQGERGPAGTNSIFVGGVRVDNINFTSDPQTQLDNKEERITPITNAEIDSLFQGGTD